MNNIVESKVLAQTPNVNETLLPKPFAFVLMPFTTEFRDVYTLGIKSACEDAGYYCERLDEQIFDETMLERIYNQIAKADLIVADMSGRNPNVFYETGYAHALGKRVILLTRDSKDIPFDLKHYFHIVYESGITELKGRLRERAAYYLAHPEASARNPFEQFSIIVNGVSVTGTTESIDVEAPVFWPANDAGQHVRLDVALHLADNAILPELEVNLRLITSNKFIECGWWMSKSSSQTYTTIDMPDGRLMHRPLSAIRLSPGDPDKIAFDLAPNEILTGESSGVMTLRLLVEGLRRDITINFTVSG